MSIECSRSPMHGNPASPKNLKVFGGLSPRNIIRDVAGSKWFANTSYWVESRVWSFLDTQIESNFPQTDGVTLVWDQRRRGCDALAASLALGLIFGPLQLCDNFISWMAALQQPSRFINCTITTSALMFLFPVIAWSLGAADITSLLSGYLIS